MKSVVLQEYYITKASMETVADIFWLPLMSVVAFGFVNQYYISVSATGQTHSLTATYMFWEFMRAVQYTTSLGIMWNIWSHNLTNMFITPLSMKEYFGTKLLTSTCVALIGITLNSIVTKLIFNFDLLTALGLTNIFLYAVNLALFGWIIGIVLIGIIFKHGTKVQALTWGVIYLFQPLTASLFPVKILPDFIQKISYMLPPTYVFEAIRANLVDPTPRWDMFSKGLMLNFIYLVVATIIFQILYQQSRKSGQFVKNDQQ